MMDFFSLIKDKSVLISTILLLLFRAQKSLLNLGFSVPKTELGFKLGFVINHDKPM